LPFECSEAAPKRFAGSRLQAAADPMMARTDNRIARARIHIATAGTVVSILMTTFGSGWPQAAPPSSLGVQEPAEQAAPERPALSQGGPSSSSAPTAREENPGLINEIGKLFQKSLSILPPLNGPQETIGDFNTRAKDAGEGLSRLAKPSSMVAGRMTCPVSSNGAPDCKAGADRLCQAKGFKEGKSLNTDSAETCSAKVLIPGRKRKPDDCRTDNYVTSALCQ
jgi:hypothetical protein